MTCQQCQPLAIDLARGVPPFDVGGAVQRAEVLSHIATCKRCAQWLREQEALSGALRAAAEADASLAAPPSVEANVMAAFRARQARKPRVVDIEPARARATDARAWRLAWPASPTGRAAGFAAAAAIVIAALTMASVRWLNPAPAVNGGASGAAGAVAGGAAGASTSPLPVTDPSSARARESASRPVTGTNAAVIEVLPEKGKKGRPAPPRVIARATRRHLTTHASSVARGESGTRGASEFSGPAFVLLPYAEPFRPTEMRHIMRVRMTRPQLAAAELQAGGVDDAVLADVLVGEDGTARAVRIVQ